MSSPFWTAPFSVRATSRAAIFLMLTMVIPSVALAADAPLVVPIEPAASPTVTIPTLFSVDLTVRTGHTAAAVQMTKTKIKGPTTTVVIALVAVAVVVAIVYVRYVISHGPPLLRRAN